MTKEGWIFIAFMILVAIPVVSAAVYWLLQGQKSKAGASDKDAQPEGASGEELCPEAVTEEMHVTVEDQSCSVKMIGTKEPKTVREFFVLFRSDEGKIFSLPVPEEMYDGFEKGQRGILALVDGEIYGFAPEEQ